MSNRMAMSSPGKFSGKGLVVSPLKVGKTGTRPLNPFAPKNSGHANELGGNMGASANRLNLMQGKPATGENGEATEGDGYYEGVNVMGPSFYQDVMIILPTLFQVLRRRPDNVTHPFLRAIFQDIPVGQDTAGIIERKMVMRTAAPQVVGAHTGGPTFNFESTGATAFPIDLGYSHMMPTKALRSEQAQDIMALLIKTSVELFDEEIDSMVLGLCMSVICKPLEVIRAEKNGAKVSIDDLFDEFFGNFAAVNKNGLNVFERIHDGVSERLVVVNREDPDWYIASNKHFSTQKLFTNANTYADSGVEGRENVKKGPQPMLSMDGGKFPWYEVKFYQSPGSSISALEQYANIGSVAVQNNKLHFDGIMRFYHGTNSKKLVPVKKMWDNVKRNFFDDKGKLIKLKKNIIDKDQGTILSFCGNGDNPAERAKLLKTFDGCFYRFNQKSNDYDQLEKIGDISEKWLPTSMVIRWMESFEKHTINASGTGNPEGAESEANKQGDTDSSGVTDILKGLLSVNFEPIEDFQGFLKTTHLHKNSSEFIIDNIAFVINESPKKYVDAITNFLKDPLQWMVDTFGSDLKTDNAPIIEFVSNSIGAQRKEYLDKFKNLDHSSITQEILNNEQLKTEIEDTLDNIGSDFKFPKNKNSSGNGSGSKGTGSGTIAKGSKDEREKALAELKHKNKELYEKVAEYLDKEITTDVLDPLVDSGMNLPWKMILWTPHIVYAGHAMIGVCTGPKTGYLGVSEINTKVMDQNNFQTAIDLDMRVMFYVPGQEGIVRRDMTVVTKIVSRDLLSYLVIKGNQESRDEDMILWKINPEQNDGHHFVTLDAWTNNLPERASYFGYYFTPRAFWPPERIRNNERFHHAFAPYVMQELNNMYYPTLARQKQKSLFSSKTNLFGVIGMCVRESCWQVNNEVPTYDAHHGLWPSTPDWMDNEPRTGKRPAQTMAAMIHDGRE